MISGIAKIKIEYIKPDQARELNLNYVSVQDKNKIKCLDNDASETPPKKKLKGQNKQRPREKKTPKSEKLCFKIGTEGCCPYGDKCCYSHDIQTYLSKKPPNINDRCYLFETYGKCPYSYSCRFASRHIIDGKNIIDNDVWEKYKNKLYSTNTLLKDVQIALRKRTYDFKKSDEVLKNFHLLTKAHQEKNNERSLNQNIEIKETDCINNVGVSNIFDKHDENISSHSDFNLNQSNKESFSLFEGSKEKRKIDFKNKLYLAPLTTVGNLPFRRICKEFGADITCSEMAMAVNLLQGQQSEWALLKRHYSEDIFGIQLCGAHPDVITRCSQLLSETSSFDFIDLNLGCPLDLVYNKGAGCGLMNRMKKLEGIIYCVSSIINVPLTLKMRTGIYNENIAHNVIKRIKKWKNCISLITIHGRSREQRYTKSANWDYIKICNELADPIPLFGNGDILSYEDYNMHLKESSVAGVMIARGALIKPWIFKEIKQQCHWDITSTERFEILKKFTNYGLEHWGSDTEGVDKTRRFLLEWLSFLYRYIPVGLLESPPQKINERPPPYYGRNDLETLMASPSCSDWIKISEMLLGPVPENFIFLPKHKANSYQ